MRLTYYVVIAALFAAGCNGCKKDKEADDTPPLPTPPPTPSATPPPTLELSTAEPAAPGEVVRPELDNREDGITGKAITVAGAKAMLQVPNEWQVTKSEFQVAAAADQKSRMAIGSYGTEGPNAAVEKLATASGLAGCSWGPPQTLTVGKDKLSTQAADGTCKRGSTDTPAAYMATENLAVVGSWDSGADRSGLFGSMRSVKKAGTGTGAPSNLIACCRALAQNAKSAPPTQAPFMLQAAASCEAAARNNNLSAVNAALSQFGMKCK